MTAVEASRTPGRTPAGRTPAGRTPAGRTPAGGGRGGRAAASKVPEATAWFWVVKVLTTGMGEATSDYLVHQMNPVLAVGIGAVCFAASLALQFAVRRYITAVYWLAVVMVAVFGTMAADVVHVALGVPYTASTAAFGLTLVAVFALWRRAERTLSIHTIITRRREAFYWSAVMATFALGTAAGDLTAATLGLGYLTSGLLFAVVIAIPGLAHWRGRLGPVAAFWLAYIVTRPLGASFADWLDMPHSWGGLGLGRGPVSLFSGLLVAAMVGYLALTRADRPAAGRHRAGRHRAPGARSPAPSSAADSLSGL